jgi:hypothetical protein
LGGARLLEQWNYSQKLIKLRPRLVVFPAPPAGRTFNLGARPTRRHVSFDSIAVGVTQEVFKCTDN